MSPVAVEVFLVINGFLLAIIGYFIKALVAKINYTADTMVRLDKEIALIGQKIDTHKTEIDHLYNSKERQDKEIKDMRDKIHTIRNLIQEVALKQQTCPALRNIEGTSQSL